MPSPAPVPPANRLLAALPRGESERLLPHLEPFALARGAVLHQPGQAVSHVYFPNSGVVSLLAVLAEGAGIEVGLVGREGALGLTVLLGGDASPFRGIVQVAGEGLRIHAEAFRARVGPASPLHGLLLRYTGAFLSQVSQSVACNSRHSVRQRCCRWLLMIHDRAGADCFPLTHEFLAGMLGVRRASVSEAAAGLRRARHIRYGRGEVTVLSRRGLESAACGCYRAVRTEFDRLLGP